MFPRSPLQFTDALRPRWVKRPGDLDIWPFESCVRVTCDVGYPCANFGLPRPLCPRLWPDERDRQTSDIQTADVRQKHRLMPPPIRGGGIIIPGWYLECCHRDHKVIARVHSVHLVNVEQHQAAADPQTKPPDLRCESACRLLSSTTTIAIYYYYSVRKLILIYGPTEGGRLSWPRHCRKSANVYLCISFRCLPIRYVRSELGA